MPCRGELKPGGGGCALREDCTGHGVIDCLICGRPTADHQLPTWGYCDKPRTRTPRPPYKEARERSKP